MFFKIIFILACLYADGKDPIFMGKLEPSGKIGNNCKSEALWYVRGGEALQCRSDRLALGA